MNVIGTDTLLHNDNSIINPCPPNNFSSAKFLFCFNFQSGSIVLKVGENIVWVSNSLDQDEKPNYSASHLDPSWLHIAL